MSGVVLCLAAILFCFCCGFCACCMKSKNKNRDVNGGMYTNKAMEKTETAGKYDYILLPPKLFHLLLISKGHIIGVNSCVISQFMVP
jgi:hypothetical protein